MSLSCLFLSVFVQLCKALCHTIVHYKQSIGKLALTHSVWRVLLFFIDTMLVKALWTSSVSISGQMQWKQLVGSNSSGNRSNWICVRFSVQVHPPLQTAGWKSIRPLCIHGHTLISLKASVCMCVCGRRRENHSKCIYVQINEGHFIIVLENESAYVCVQEWTWNSLCT